MQCYSSKSPLEGWGPGKEGMSCWCVKASKISFSQCYLKHLKTIKTEKNFKSRTSNIFHFTELQRQEYFVSILLHSRYIVKTINYSDLTLNSRLWFSQTSLITLEKTFFSFYIKNVFLPSKYCKYSVIMYLYLISLKKWVMLNFTSSHLGYGIRGLVL